MVLWKILCNLIDAAAIAEVLGGVGACAPVPGVPLRCLAGQLGPPLRGVLDKLILAENW